MAVYFCSVLKVVSKKNAGNIKSTPADIAIYPEIITIAPATTTAIFTIFVGLFKKFLMITSLASPIK